MGNPFRGEVEVELDGRLWRARLSLGALAELEEALGAEGLGALLARFEGGAMGARDIIAVVVAGLRGGGWTGRAAEVAQGEIAGGPLGAARLAAQLIARAFDLPPPASRPTEGARDGLGL